MNKYLTVKDVMEKLKEYPEDMDVVIDNVDSGGDSISKIEVQFIFSGNKKPVYSRIALITEEEEQE